MKIFAALLTILILSGAIPVQEMSPSLWKKANKKLDLIFKDQIITKRSLELSEAELTNNRKQFVTKGIYQLFCSNVSLGYLVFMTSMGRYESFEYIIVYSPELSVKSIDILEYNSSHGGEIASQKWLKQFVGYDGKPLKYGSDIDAVSGATYSATSLVKDVESVTLFMKKIEK